MSRKTKKSKSAEVKLEGPIKPGSTLYRMLELIAQRIAKDEAAKASAIPKPNPNAIEVTRNPKP